MSGSFRAKAERALGQSAAMAALASFLPMLLLIGFLLWSNTDEPVLQTHEVLGLGGTQVRIHRFRTTGRGTAAFRAIGWVLRLLRYDNLPALWDVARGQVGFAEFCRLVRIQ
jgi:lipopolysaccharide/colanic/teichoic acid biosynthesis glycosyltransferase